MSESVRVSEKKSEATKEDKTSHTRPSEYSQSVNPSVDRILFLQRTIGNQVVGRLIKSGVLQGKLKIRQPWYEQEQEVDRMPELIPNKMGYLDLRCPLDEEYCEKDPLVDYQGSGETTCDTSTGNMVSNITEHCAGDCVAQHEAVHVKDRGNCCAKVKKCLDKAGGDIDKQNECNTKFETWYPKFSNFTECRAYSKEVTCLTNFIKSNCKKDNEKIDVDCCNTLQEEELPFAKKQMKDNCAASKFVPCPL
jgi:hypothetical protein